MADAVLSSSFHNMTLHSSQDREVKQQARANEIFFVQFSPNQPRLTSNDAGYPYDISKKDTPQVVGILEEILNTQWYPDASFCFTLASKGMDNPITFCLRPQPTKHQPGNGILWMDGSNGALKYNEIPQCIQQRYGARKERFWTDLGKLFQYNDRRRVNHAITYEVYMLFVFEIARRLVRLQSAQDTEAKRGFDSLPIGMAIARLLVLKPDAEEVFLDEGKYNCFQSSPEERMERIQNINESYNELRHKEELYEAFCNKGPTQFEAAVRYY